MYSVMTSLLLAACVLLCAGSASASWTDIFKNKCPPSGFNAVDNFNLTAYASAPWYPQRQVPLIYQKPDDLYCVRAQYRLMDPHNPSEGVYVYNSGRRGSVNGSLMGNTDSGPFALQAVPDEDADRASKLQVGPKALSFASAVIFGPYWVVAVGASTNQTIMYDWAIVSGGKPSYSSGSACSTFLPFIPTTWQYKGGLWLFTRKPVDPVGSAAAEKAAKALGFNTNQLQDVTQAGCTYPALI